MTDLLRNKNILSYENIRNTIQMFRSGVNSGQPEYMYDEPGCFFWKPLFYFLNSNSENVFGGGGLLHPSWMITGEYKEVKASDISCTNSKALRDCEGVEYDAKLQNSAYNYLMRNGEVRRAKLLEDFITILSDISSNTPWYFKEVSGLDEAVNKRTFYEAPKIDSVRKSITITCLTDSIDTRIGTMLDMYRSICYSWQTKREILPANLRKFDMGIYVFTKPYQSYKRDMTGGYKPLSWYDNHKFFGSDDTTIQDRSYKYLEFHNCEIELDSCKFGDSISNEEGSPMEYKIVISYDNCYDDRYNDQFLGFIGDSIITDILAEDDLITNTTGERFTNLSLLEINELMNTDPEKATQLKNTVYGAYQRKNLTGIEHYSSVIGNMLSNALNNAIDSTVGVAESAIESAAGGLLLGNLYHGSLANVWSDLKQGRLIKGAIDGYNTIVDENTYKRALGNLTGTVLEESKKNAYAIHKEYEKTQKKKMGNTPDLGTMSDNNTIKTPTTPTVVKKLGNLNKAKSAIKNI